MNDAIRVDAEKVAAVGQVMDRTEGHRRIWTVSL
jgi:hypothetical protein